MPGDDPIVSFGVEYISHCVGHYVDVLNLSSMMNQNDKKRF